MEKVFPDSTQGDMFTDGQCKEAMTQEQLAKAFGIPRSHIAEMQINKRGKLARNGLIHWPKCSELFVTDLSRGQEYTYYPIRNAH